MTHTPDGVDSENDFDDDFDDDFDLTDGATSSEHDERSESRVERNRRRLLQLQATGIVAIALAIVAISAYILDRRTGDVNTRDNGVLTAPITPADLDRAELAQRVADAVIAADADSGATLGGYRSSGRGWVFGNARNDNDDSLFTSLSPALGDDIADLTAALSAGDDVLVHACGDAVAVFVRSAVVVSAHDAAFWADNGCSPVPLDVIGQPGYFVIGGHDDG